MDLRGTPRRLARRADVAMLLFRYARSDLVRNAGADAALLDDVDSDKSREEGESLARDLEELGPTFIKLGQLLSTRADLMPPPVLEALSRLQDDLEPFGFDIVRETIETELGVRLTRAFSEFDEKPLAAASLGQVHAARMRDGREVVVKVQRPDVRRRALDDLDVLESIASRLEAHTEQGRVLAAGDLLEQFRRSLLDELDYRKEASNLVRLRQVVARRPRLIVPAPYDDFTTGRVLTMDRVDGRKVTDLSGLARLDVDGVGLARELFDAYLDQILVEGFFHADPHPGNVLLTPDGRLGLIDVGMVARVTPELRERLVQLLLAVGERRGEEVARIAADLCDRPREWDRSRFTADVADVVERTAMSTVADLDAGRLVLDLTRTCVAAGLRPPAELSMVGKALLNLDLVARKLDPDVAPVDLVRARAMELARSGMTPSMSGVLNAAMEARDFVEQLPGRVNRVMDVMSSGKFELQVHAFDEKAFLQGLHGVANRLATGVVLAALIIGAALLAGVHTKTTIGGYPAVAFVLFLVAAVGGMVLLVSIVASSLRVRRR